MFEIGWTELLIIGVVALIVVGPKDLPGMFRTLGQFTGKMRKMAREFQRAMEQAADESGVKDIASDLRSVSSARNLGLDKLKSTAADFTNSWTEDGDSAVAKATKSTGKTSQASAKGKSGSKTADSYSAKESANGSLSSTNGSSNGKAAPMSPDPTSQQAAATAGETASGETDEQPNNEPSGHPEELEGQKAEA